MKVTIEFEIDNPDKVDLAILLRDALDDFTRLRSPVGRYVEERYASHDESFRAMKRESVAKRIKAAYSVKSLSVVDPVKPGDAI